MGHIGGYIVLYGRTWAFASHRRVLKFQALALNAPRASFSRVADQISADRNASPGPVGLLRHEVVELLPRPVVVGVAGDRDVRDEVLEDEIFLFRDDRRARVHALVAVERRGYLP